MNKIWHKIQLNQTKPNLSAFVKRGGSVSFPLYFFNTPHIIKFLVALFVSLSVKVQIQAKWILFLLCNSILDHIVGNHHQSNDPFMIGTRNWKQQDVCVNGKSLGRLLVIRKHLEHVYLVTYTACRNPKGRLDKSHKSHIRLFGKFCVENWK